MRTPTLAHRLGAEALGTVWLVFGGCGSAIFAAHFMHKTDPSTWGSASSASPCRSASRS